MSLAAPPVAPRQVGMDDGDGLRRIRFRLVQILVCAATVLATGWICTFGWIPAILALLVAKHVLVAVLLWGIGVDRRLRRK